MARYPKAWMNYAATGIRVAALGSAAVATVYFLFVYKTVKIPVDMDGMAPIVQPGRSVLLNTRPWPLERGDVVIYSPYPKLVFVGRVAGLPGEMVSLVGGRLYINGQIIEDYKYNTVVTVDGVQADIAPVKVMPGYLFILNDNGGSKMKDSRSLGLVSAASVTGAVALCF